MGMTPQEIQEKHFHDTFRGYSHEEVDLFLDEVAVAFERLYRENQSFMRRVVDLEEQLKRAQEAAQNQPDRAHEAFEEDAGVSESTLKRMLLIAQETADRAVQEARQRAREIQEQARARADEMMEHAERRVRELSSQRMEKEKELERAREALRRFDQQYRASFRLFIESQLQVLKDLPATPPESDVLKDLPAASTGSDMFKDLPSTPGVPDSEPGPEGAPVFQPGGQPTGVSQSISPELVGMETQTMAVPPADDGLPGMAPEEQGAGVPADFGSIAPEPSVEAPEAPSDEWRGEASVAPADGNDEEAQEPKVDPGSAAAGRSTEKEGDERQSSQAPRSRSRRERRHSRDAAETTDARDEEEDRLIRELFWGDEN